MYTTIRIHLRVGVAGLALVKFALTHVGAAPGDLDPTFDGDGKVTTVLHTNVFGSSQAQGMAVQADGKIVVCGTVEGQFGVARYLTSGALDGSFGTTGIVRTVVGTNDGAYANGIVIQPDGRIIVAGSANDGTNDGFALARYLTNGVLDATFGTGGTRLAGYGSAAASGNAVTLQSDGKIVMVGNAFNGTRNDFALARFLTNGLLDSSFDGDGFALTQIDAGSSTANAVRIQSDGKIVAVGSANNSNFTRSSFALARYLTNGLPDPAFGSGGKASSMIDENGAANALAFQTDGRLLVAGYSSTGFVSHAVLLRFATNGLADEGFGGTGAVKVTNWYGSALAIQPGGKIIVAGSATNDLGLLRFNADGSPDPGFGNGGKVTMAFFSGSDNASAVALQGDGKIVTAGSSFNGFGFVFTLARFIGDGGTLPPPQLGITSSTGTVTVSWPLAYAGWTLETTNVLPTTPTVWPQVSPPYDTTASGISFSTNVTGSDLFFRLRSP